MSNEPSSRERHTTPRDADNGGTESWPPVNHDTDWGPGARTRVALAASAAALALTAGATTLTVLRNLPYDPVAPPEWVRALVGLGTPSVVALALATTAVVSHRRTVRVGLLYAGVFALLAEIDARATLPALVAVTAGGGVAVAGSVWRQAPRRRLGRGLTGAAIVVGVALSLGSTAGLLGVEFRGLGAFFALAGTAAVGYRAVGDWLAMAVGLLTAGAVLFAGLTRPYIAGSGFLVGFSVVGVPHLLPVLALGGGTAAVVAGLRRRAYGLAVGAGLLVFAGVPATLPQAAAVVLGAPLALKSVDGLVDADGDTGPTEGVGT